MEERISGGALREMAHALPLASLMSRATELRDIGHGDRVTFSPKVFIPLTRLCRDVCHYCTFAHPPRRGAAAYLSPDEVLGIARAGADAGCHEALFTLGDKPELRYRAAREALHRFGHDTTISYLAEMAALVTRETGLLCHVNPGVMSEADIARLRKVSVSQGIMLESASERLCRRDGPHFGSPDKQPAARLDTLAAAGRQRVPMTSGMLIGIGETRDERIDAILALRRLHEAHGHIQEIIVQNFRAKPGTRMADAPEPDLDELLWTVAVTRLAFGAAMTVQAPPNLSPGAEQHLIAAGLNDWGGVSPLTPDHVNPEAPWPHLERLRAATESAGKRLATRLPVHPMYVQHAAHWIDPSLAPALRRAADSEGLARDHEWAPGLDTAPPALSPRTTSPAPALRSILKRVTAGDALSEREIVALFAARDGDAGEVIAAADELRRGVCGERVSYVVTRNVNYTNMCGYRCGFCAFSKGRRDADLRGAPYDLDLDEVSRRAAEAWDRGATEICLQGGIHPDYTGNTYLELCRVVKRAAPGLHLHAFSPLEIRQGAATLGLNVPRFLEKLQAAGLGSLPGTAAEILDDDVRAVLCPDKLTSAEWLDVVGAAHRIGLPTTATIMFGHVDTPQSWARHLLALRRQQRATGGFTEFVPLPFVHMEAPIYRRGLARRGPTFREAVLMHAVARLVLHPAIPNIQVSWVKMGAEGAASCLDAGVNDLGGTLMNESISRAAGTRHGQEFSPAEMEALIRECGRTPWQRTTLYAPAPDWRRAAALAAPPLVPPVDTPYRRAPRESLLA